MIECLATHASEILVLLPVPQRIACLVGCSGPPALQLFNARGQVGPQPIEGLAAEARTLVGIALHRVLALAATSEGSGTGGLVTRLVFQVIGGLMFMIASVWLIAGVVVLEARPVYR